MDTQTFVLSVEYDESHEGIRETFGLEKKDTLDVLNLFRNEDAQGKTYTQRLMELIDQGQISGSYLVYAAAQYIKEEVQNLNRAVMMQEHFRELFGSGISNLFNFKNREDHSDDDEEYYHPPI